MNFSVRKARLEDRPALKELIAKSARELSEQDYRSVQIEAAISSVFGVDTDLIRDGTYFVAEDDSGLIGCGGWSKRRTLFGGDQFPDRDASYLDPEIEPAKIRAFFVHPDHARKGVARAILSACESEAAKAGFRALELMSTLPGIKFYEACGYAGDTRFELDLGGVKLELLPMRKELEK
jgi:GNAT superfamily N-acetyltransferase